MKSEIFEIPILICLFLTAIALFGDDLANSVYMILDFVGSYDSNLRWCGSLEA